MLGLVIGALLETLLGFAVRVKSARYSTAEAPMYIRVDVNADADTRRLPCF